MDCISNLLHLISISLAIGLAYIALDRFRFTNRVKGMFDGAIDQIISKDNNPAGEDTAVALLRHKKKVTLGGGLGPKFLFIGPKMFGSGDKAGWDVLAIYIAIAVEYLFLLVGSICPGVKYPWLFWGIITACLIGSISPVIFIQSGARAIKLARADINEIYGGYNSAKGCSLSIEDIGDKFGIPR